MTVRLLATRAHKHREYAAVAQGQEPARNTSNYPPAVAPFYGIGGGCTLGDSNERTPSANHVNRCLPLCGIGQKGSPADPDPHRERRQPTTATGAYTSAVEADFKIGGEKFERFGENEGKQLPMLGRWIKEKRRTMCRKAIFYKSRTESFKRKD